MSRERERERRGINAESTRIAESFIHYVVETTQIAKALFAPRRSVLALLLTLVFVIRIPASGLVPQPLCVRVSHVALRAAPRRFASCKLLNSARCIRASESGIRARSSLSSPRAFSGYTVGGGTGENSPRLNVARIQRQFDTHCRGNHL